MRLSDRQLDYLKAATYLSWQLRQMVADATHAGGGRELEVDAETADIMQAALTDRLAQIGFDAECNLTEEGAMLEDLIDTFASTWRHCSWVCPSR